MSTDRLDSLLTLHPFTRLNALLQGIPAGGTSQPLSFSVGEPQTPPPPMLAEVLRAQSGGWSRYSGGFFLWLDVGDGEAAAQRLWATASIRVLPGAYMGRPDETGVNPGQRYIRVALVHDTDAIVRGLRRMLQVLAADSRFATAPRSAGGRNGRKAAASA